MVFGKGGGGGGEVLDDGFRGGEVSGMRVLRGFERGL